MAKPELGTKRIDPETGRKFYDLNKDPIVSPYTGKSYPLSYFEGEKEKVKAKVVAETEDDEKDTEEADVDPKTVSLTDVEAEEKDGGSDNLPDVDDTDDEDTNDDDDADDTFLEDDDEDDDVADILGGGRDDDDDADR